MSVSAAAATAPGWIAQTTAIETPALLLDERRVERNLRRIQSACAAAGVTNRPHVKTHKCSWLAMRQIQLGAVGVTCQKLAEAEAMVDGGVKDVFIPYNLVGERRLRRLSGLMRRAAVSVSCDHEALLPGLSRAADRAGEELAVLVDVDVGMGRTGVADPVDAVALAGAVAAAPCLRFAGFAGYPASERATEMMRRVVAGAGEAGLAIERVSLGGTPTLWELDRFAPPVTEYRVGRYVYNDANTVAGPAAEPDDVALTLMSTVVSTPAPDRVVVDAGSKTLGADRAQDGTFGYLLDHPSARVIRLSEEHATLDAAGLDLRLGDRVRIVPQHVCSAVNQFERMWTMVESGGVQPRVIDGRGRSQ
jgi:D-serine deaminase-like pyridoxal phosphate-dependent protein